MKRKPQIVTFGCRLNAYESEVIRSTLLDTPSEDMVVINTCSVTHEAERQARQAIRRARRENPLAEIIVTGCAAQVDPASFASMPEVDRVLGNIEKLHPASYKSADPILVNNIMSVRETAGRGPGPGLRAGPARLRSPLHVLHYSVWPRQQPFRADWTDRYTGTPTSGERLCGNCLKRS